MKSIVYAFTALLLFVATTLADVVTLKNGDRVTGTLVTVKAGSLDLKSDILGDLTIPMAQVTSFAVTKPVVVVVKDREPLQGKVELDPSGNWKVTTNSGSQTIKAASADLVMPAEAYQTLEKAGSPLQDWKGSASLGYSIQRGDQSTSSFATNVTAVRERPETPIFERHFRTDFTLTTLLSGATQTTTTGTTETVNSRTFTTNLREDYLFTATNFVFGFAQFDHVGAQGLYLRQTYGGGYGHDLIKTSRTDLSLLAGITYVHEKFFTGAFDSSPQALAGEKLGIQITKRIRLDHDLNFYPDLSNGGQYRFDTSTTLSAKLSNKLSLNTGVIDLYLSNPATGSKKNNVNFTTGIGYTF